ncbi:MAG TPA: glycoside hydrolase family 3 N-terminal domain-containing protein [Bryobacteraceae bacterium]|nr:glycoside hydrolase family 3 N-terminal domain-containing protein [Bryobacteraceae bacterium]
MLARAWIALVLCIAFSTSASSAATHAKVKKAVDKSINPSVRQWTRSMSLRDKAAQLIIVEIYGELANTRSAEYRKYQHLIRDLHVGGVIVTGHSLNGGIRNAEPYAMAALLNRLQRLARTPLFVAADFERGASMRVNSTTAWPYSMAFTAAQDLAAVTEEGADTARDARAMGVNWVFAPVADVNNNPDNPIINIRSFGENPEQVASFVEAYINGAHSDRKNPVLVTAKHFPGHGDTTEDSHMALPRLDADRDRIEAVELTPFRSAIAAGVDAVMTAHLNVPSLEPDNLPATVSSKIITGVLREELGFHGLIVTDAMEMQGLAMMFDSSEASIRAIEAGADVLLMPKHPEEAIRGLVAAVERGRISRKRLDESVNRVLAAKARLGLRSKKLVDLEAIADVVDSPESGERAQEVADRAVTLIADSNDSLPVRHPESTCLIALTEGRRSQQGIRLIDEVKKRVPNMTTTVLDPGMSKADLDQVAEKTSSCSQIIAAAFVTVAAYRGNVALPGGYPDFLNGLIGGKAPVMLASLGNPYLVRAFPKVSAYLTTYSPTPTSEISLAKALFGEIAITGHLPVSIPGIAKYGDGIQLPAASPGTIPVAKGTQVQE